MLTRRDARAGQFRVAGPLSRRAGAPSRARCDGRGRRLVRVGAGAERGALAERAASLEVERDALRRAVRDDWERINVVPVDQVCLDRAAEIGRTQPVRTVDAIHLAAADRLPKPVTFCTFDPRQIPVALALGFNVTST